ncbi:DUF4158 domain-containing protein [Nocardiopsis kunsanensis]|uniref:DUF4158 domain-containing protein n=1 Tax=Nocardiopsis kunsanensis TaxID=141693 RepID=UPI000346E490|nr:DUF4158 domain-containing protein [Nocardiopsis kunsanensis]
MPHEYLSDEQIARYGRFPDELSVSDLEQCFRLSPDALSLARSKRTPATQLGWALQWGTVRLLGLFQADRPARVPERAVDFVADQLGLDPACLAEYRAREKTAYEHAWQIREAFGYREFTTGEEDLRAYLAARVWASEEGPRALFDRAVLYLLEHQILLPGLTVLSRLVRQVRKEENARLHQVLNERIPHPVRTELTGLLQAHEDARFSELELLRTEPGRISSPGMVQALDRTSRIAGIGAGGVEAGDVPQAKLQGLARYGMRAKAPALAELAAPRQGATLLATVRHLGGADKVSRKGATPVLPGDQRE